MDGGGSVFTQVSRFLEQGGLLNKFVDVQAAGDADGWDDVELEDIIGEKKKRNREFFEAMEEYFRE